MYASLTALPEAGRLTTAATLPRTLIEVPCAPVAPVAPVKPVAPVAPVKPVAPVAPVNPVAPVVPNPAGNCSTGTLPEMSSEATPPVAPFA
jgi:hypothetical protein